MFGFIKAWKTGRERARKEKERLKLFYPSLREIVEVTCRNRRSVQLDLYGKCLTEYDIEWIKIEVESSVFPYFSADRIIRAIEHIVKNYEDRLSVDLEATIKEYGC
jgi:hypothetical protein